MGSAVVKGALVSFGFALLFVLTVNGAIIAEGGHPMAGAYRNAAEILGWITVILAIPWALVFWLRETIDVEAEHGGMAECRTRLGDAFRKIGYRSKTPEAESATYHHRFCLRPRTVVQIDERIVRLTGPRVTIRAVLRRAGLSGTRHMPARA